MGAQSFKTPEGKMTMFRKSQRSNISFAASAKSGYMLSQLSARSNAMSYKRETDNLMNVVKIFTRSSISWRFSGFSRAEPPSSMVLIRFFSAFGYSHHHQHTVPSDRTHPNQV